MAQAGMAGWNLEATGTRAIGVEISEASYRNITTYASDNDSILLYLQVTQRPGGGAQCDLWRSLKCGG